MHYNLGIRVVQTHGSTRRMVPCHRPSIYVIKPRRTFINSKSTWNMPTPGMLKDRTAAANDGDVFHLVGGTFSALDTSMNSWTLQGS